MNVLARFNGQNGEITIIEERTSGARLYHEAGVDQSYVLPGGHPGLQYICFMAALLMGNPDIVLFGCGGGALATELHKKGSYVTVVDNNPVSFSIARQFFWMPRGIACVVDEMTDYLARIAHHYPAIGVDIGGPCFDYEDALDNVACALLARSLAPGGTIAINIACDWAEDQTPDLIAERLKYEDLSVWTCSDLSFQHGGNTIIVARDGPDDDQQIKTMASQFKFRLRRV